MGKDMATTGYYNYTPMFVGVGGVNPKLNDIVPTSLDPQVTDLGGGQLLAFVLDTNRKFAKSFAYKTIDGDWVETEGWYFGDDETPTTYELGPGESLQINTTYAVRFTHSGEVDQAQYEFSALAGGYYMIGNQHATKMKLNDIAPTSLDPQVTDLGGGQLLAFVLDTNRKFAKSFAYKTVDGDWADADGWYFGDEEVATTYELEPGEVLQMNTTYAVKLTFPDQSIK